MRAFLLAALVAVVLAVVAAYSLNAFQESIATAASSPSSVRLDQQQQVNFYGRTE